MYSKKTFNILSPKAKRFTGNKLYEIEVNELKEEKPIKNKEPIKTAELRDK